jgi:hypothetical protein
MTLCSPAASLRVAAAIVHKHLPLPSRVSLERVSSLSSAIRPLSRPVNCQAVKKNNYHYSARSIDCFLRPCTTNPPYQDPSTRPNKQITITIMAGSKFVEILDTSATPYSQANVDLQATIDESRRRSASSGSISSSNESVQSLTSPTSPTTNAQPMKMRLRALSLRRPKKT